MEDSTWTKLGAALTAVVSGRALVRRLSAYDLRDKVAIVTGGSRGLGLLISRELARRGASVAICARDEAELERAVADLAARGGTVIGVVCDVTDPEQLDALVARVREVLGPIDVLVNNAGVIQVGPMEVMSGEDYEEAMAVHFWAPLQLSYRVLPDMVARKSGRIANITSIGGKIAVPHLLPYTASKFALVGLSEGMHAELARHGVCVTTVVPGLMRTGSVRNAYFKGQYEQEYAWFAVGDSSHLTSMRAERAARRIVNAIRHGDAEITLSVQAQVASRLYALAPGLAQRLLGLVDRVLPKPGGIGKVRATGSISGEPSFWTRASDRAAVRNNEV